jgi:hypothetical protein
MCLGSTATTSGVGSSARIAPARSGLIARDRLGAGDIGVHQPVARLGRHARSDRTPLVVRWTGH